MADDVSARPMRALVPGTRLGRYVIVDRIGRGGMAEVFLARAQGLSGFEKIVALKVIHEQMVDDASHVEMLLKEARVAATLDHPGIVQVFDVGADDNEHYLTMEFVHGRDLRQILRALAGHDRMPLLLAISIVQEIARALQYAHTRADGEGRPLGIVHRDVSPSNVIVSFTGAVKLTDFGIAKVTAHTSQTRTGTFKGKFGYMSPEQYLQQDVDARSDVFSLGIVLYEITTGRRAFAGENAFAVMNKAVDGSYTAPASVVPDYPPALADIVARALAPDLDARYPDAESMAEDLDRLARALGGPSTPAALADWVGDLFDRPAPPDVSRIAVRVPIDEGTPEPSFRPHRSARRGPWLAAAAALVAGALGWSAGRSGDADRSDADPPKEAIAADVTRVAPAPRDMSPPASNPESEPTPTSVATPSSPSSAGAPAEPPRVRSRPRASTKRKKKPDTVSTAPSGRELESLLPPSAKPRG